MSLLVLPAVILLAGATAGPVQTSVGAPSAETSKSPLVIHYKILEPPPTPKDESSEKNKDSQSISQAVPNAALQPPALMRAHRDDPPTIAAMNE